MESLREDEKKRNDLIHKEIKDFEKYVELINRKPVLDKLLEELRYEDFLAEENGKVSQRMYKLLESMKMLSEYERKIIIQQYNKYAYFLINEHGEFIRNGKTEGNIVRTEEQSEKDTEQDTEEMKARYLYDYWRFMAVLEGNEGYDELVFAEAQKLTKLYPENSEYRDTLNQLQAKMQEQGKQNQQMSECMENENGTKSRYKNKQKQEIKNMVVELWISRFNKWYNSMDKVSGNVKIKLLKMKYYIEKTLSGKLKEKTDKKQQNCKEQDTSER